MKLIKRIFAFSLMLCLLFLCVCPTTALAADYDGKTDTFYVRKSGSYAKTGCEVRIESMNSKGTMGHITFLKEIKIGGYTIPKGTCYTYTVLSMKEKGSIELLWNKYQSEVNCAPAVDANIRKFVGKIHIDKAKNCPVAYIWKIDSLKFGSKSGIPTKKANVYFRNN